MACCLLGALVISQLLAGVHFLKRHRRWFWLAGGVLAVTITLTVWLLVRDLRQPGGHRHGAHAAALR